MLSSIRRSMSASQEGTMDPEQHPVAEKHLVNTTVRNMTWRGVTVTVKDRETKEPKAIVDAVDGIVEAGKSSFPSW